MPTVLNRMSSRAADATVLERNVIRIDLGLRLSRLRPSGRRREFAPFWRILPFIGVLIVGNRVLRGVPPSDGFFPSASLFWPARGACAIDSVRSYAWVSQITEKRKRPAFASPLVTFFGVRSLEGRFPRVLGHRSAFEGQKDKLIGWLSSARFLDVWRWNFYPSPPLLLR